VTDFDFRNEPSITITDLYSTSGQHLKSVLRTEDGTILEESGPNPNKDVVFCPPHIQEEWKKIMESV
jgi:predicted GNAT family acetyltransferase